LLYLSLDVVRLCFALRKRRFLQGMHCEC
jgi:hypothetical protein